MTNREIVDIYLNNGLIQTCVDFQFAKQKKDLQFKDDFFQDLILILLNYDNEKLNDAHLNNHFNAFLSSILVKNLWSHTSRFYKTYKKFDERTDEITPTLEDTIADG